MTAYRPWTDDETAQLYQMDFDGLSHHAMSVALKRSKASIRSKLRDDRLTPDEREAKKEKRNSFEREKRSKNNARSYAMRVYGDRVEDRPSADLLRERDTRMALPVRDLTAYLLGDPPIGRSALDRRLGA